MAEHLDQYGSQWAAIQSIAGKIGAGGAVKQLERENGELKRANEILRTGSAYLAQAELDRRRK